MMAIAGPASAQEQAVPKTQYVIVSFDGAYHEAQWERSRRLARETGASFTYFLSCVYLLDREQRKLYSAPGTPAGRSQVGFAQSREEIARRLRQIWAARLEGHEIASHGCGHFDGAAWDEAAWRAEFAQFRDILSQSWTRSRIPFEPAGWQDFVHGEIDGFRAPYLATGDELFAALAADGFRYDASIVSQGPAEPDLAANVARFALPMIPEGPNGRPIIAMDYNLFVRHSGGLERGDAEGVFEARTLAAFTDALDAQLSGDRVPLQIGFHFTLMNDGAYWRALERFAREACGRVEVRCVSYRGFLDATAPEHVRSGADG